MSAGAYSTLALAALLAGALLGCNAPAPAAREAPSGRCAGCHLQEYESTAHPPHPGVRPLTCAVCHSESNWHPSRLVHSFPLEGAHAKAACFDCHQNPSPLFEGTTRQCSVCHAKERQPADLRVPHHASFPSDCQTCHDTTGWKPTLAHPPLDAVLLDESTPSPAPVSSTLKLRDVSPTSKPKPTAVSGQRSKTPSNATPDQVSGASRPWKRQN